MNIAETWFCYAVLPSVGMLDVLIIALIVVIVRDSKRRNGRV